ncbi:glycosyltransferase [Thalassobellus citreus]|uniref:glycosyltransferase n=1 Tax=Thalassobellus citreus TaxID=3367752 RepID=UPI003798741B
MNKKICLLTDSLSSGGAEKMVANLSASFVKRGYVVTVVSMTNFIDYQFKGELYNFGIVKEENNKLKAFLKFNFFFKKNKFDYIIDHRVRTNFFKELLLSKLVFRKHNVMYCVHSYYLPFYFSFINTPWLSRLPHVKKKSFVSVSNEIRKHLKSKLDINSSTIYNFINADDLLISKESIEVSYENYIIAVGSLKKLKQFDKLLNSYQASELWKKGVKLIILGDGPEKENLKLQISNLQLEDFVELLPFTKKPQKLISNAKALVLTSKVEGFPMVLLEAVSLDTPIIAFDCKSGPSEIIVNDKNGVLVENQNEEQLSIALNKLLLNKTYYNKIKKNMHEGLDKFSEETIIQKWIHLIENQQ